MAINPFQRAICRLIAANRIEQGESYVGGGVALNLLTGGCRLSRDIDLFHDTEAALDATWTADRALLEDNGLQIDLPGDLESKLNHLIEAGFFQSREEAILRATEKLIESLD